jgi:glycosyltransferase involved in cell wall biosynthesis
MKQVTKPLVSVVMPVRNAGNFLLEAIESILNQTYTNFELVIVNDASTDNTAKILSSFKDNRMRVFRNKRRLGVTKSANLAISKAKGEYVARMDGDDVADSKRIEKQINFLIKNKNVVAVGGQCELIDSNGFKIGDKRFPFKSEDIKRMIFSSVPLQQPTLMVNTGLLPKGFVWYDENYSSAEELELLFKLFKFGEVRNLKDYLLKYRIHKGNTSLVNPKRTFTLTLKTRFLAISRYGYRPTFMGIVTTIIQTVLISLIPESWIYPIYSVVRGTNKINVKINLDANILLQKAFGLAKA